MNDEGFRLTPVDVRAQEFRRRALGYDTEGVEDFRQRVADELVFLQVLEFEFVGLDDYGYVVQNPHLRDGLSREALWGAFRPYFSNWIPLTALSLQLDYALYGLDPAGYHFTNVALHTLSAVLLFFGLTRLTGEVWRSGFVAAVFAVHPLHVESVAWISERKDALSGVFWMLTLLAYGHYREQPASIPRYLWVLLCLALGLLAKPTLVTLPFVLLLLDYWPLGRLRRRDSGALRSRQQGAETATGVSPRGELVGASTLPYSVCRTQRPREQLADS